MGFYAQDDGLLLGALQAWRSWHDKNKLFGRITRIGQMITSRKDRKGQQVLDKFSLRASALGEISLWLSCNMAGDSEIRSIRIFRNGLNCFNDLNGLNP
jgi:hypothetical protein